MDKKQLIRELVAQLLEQSEATSRSSQAAWQASVEAPSKMESRYDSAKSEQDWLSHALALSSLEMRKEIQRIQTVDLTPSESVREGSLVSARREGGGRAEWYFVLPAGSRKALQEETSQRVVVVTPKSPVGVIFMGKISGSRCKVRMQKGSYSLTILSVR